MHRNRQNMLFPRSTRVPWIREDTCWRDLLSSQNDTSLEITHDPTSSLTSPDQHHQEWWRMLYVSDLEQSLLSLVATKGKHNTGEKLLFGIWRGIEAFWCGTNELWRGDKIPCQHTTWEAWLSPKPLLDQTAPWSDRQTILLSRPSNRRFHSYLKFIGFINRFQDFRDLTWLYLQDRPWFWSIFELI